MLENVRNTYKYIQIWVKSKDLTQLDSVSWWVLSGVRHAEPQGNWQEKGIAESVPELDPTYHGFSEAAARQSWMFVKLTRRSQNQFTLKQPWLERSTQKSANVKLYSRRWSAEKHKEKVGKQDSNEAVEF